jgi:hypothetical protein
MLPDSPIALRIFPKCIDASCYNAIRLALRRIANPLRVDLPQHRGLSVILDDQVWFCVDGLHEDLPVLAWRDFEVRERNSLQEAVNCRLHLYHTHAGLIMGSALEALEAAVLQCLEQVRTGSEFGAPQ